METGTKIRVFKERKSDCYHKVGEYKYGIILKKYPNFYLTILEESYRECFYESELEVIKDDKDFKPKKDISIRFK